MTTGYGSHYSAEGTNLWYTSSFSGTSSASPLVTSCVAALEAVYEVANGGTKLTPALALSTLVSTGSPQQNGTYPISQNIGPRPDLVAAIAALPTPTCCVTRGDFNGDGPIDIADLTAIVAYFFGGGPGPACAKEGDINGDGSTDVADLTYLVAYLFGGGPPPPIC